MPAPDVAEDDADSLRICPFSCKEDDGEFLVFNFDKGGSSTYQRHLSSKHPEKFQQVGGPKQQKLTFDKVLTRVPSFFFTRL